MTGIVTFINQCGYLGNNRVSANPNNNWRTFNMTKNSTNPTDEPRKDQRPGEDVNRPSLEG